MNANVLAFFSALRGVLIAIGSAMMALNLQDTSYYAHVMQASGLVMIAGPMLWAVFEKLVTLKKTAAAAVQAGINLVRSGAAVDHEGNIMVSVGPDTSPPAPVTVQSAQQIIKDFAPAASSIEKK
jgi:hypothetical protein